MARKLPPVRVARPWGRTRLWQGHADADASAPIGEIWFPGDDGSELLVKILFTARPLSIQVHPDDARARAAGYPRGKDEAWFILDAEPGARIGLGTREPVGEKEFAESVSRGAIEALMDWRQVSAGDVIYSPAGAVHALGAGITAIEIQQNVDLTYRLFDYASARELHLQAGLAAAKPEPFAARFEPIAISPLRSVLFEGGKFVLEKWELRGPARIAPFKQEAWLVPIEGYRGAHGALAKCGCLKATSLCQSMRQARPLSPTLARSAWMCCCTVKSDN